MLFRRSTACFVVFLLSFLLRLPYPGFRPDAAPVLRGKTDTACSAVSSGTLFCVLQGGNSQGIVLCLSRHRLMDARGMNTLQNNIENGSSDSIDWKRSDTDRAAGKAGVTLSCVNRSAGEETGG